MIREQNVSLKKFLLFIDLLAVVVSFVAGYFLRVGFVSPYVERYFGKGYDKIFPFSTYIELLPVLLIIWGVFLYYFGMYRSTGIRRISEAFFISSKSALLGFVVFGSYIFILHKQEEVNRLLMGITFIIAILLITIEKTFFLYVLNVIRNRGTSFKATLFPYRSILIVGTGKRVEEFINMVDRNPDWGLHIIGLVDIDPALTGRSIENYKILGTFDDVSRIIHENVIDEVVFIVPRSWINKIEDLMLLCENEGLTINFATNLFSLKFSQIKQADLQGFPLLIFENASHNPGALLIKRIFDFVVTGIALLLLSPLFLISIILVKGTSEGPAFFKQERCSLYGRKFVFYKFRTMVVDAEDKLKDIFCYNEMKGPVFKMTNDPRVTKVGVWLRKYSLDELPQLWNVLRGDMSLVGPRPPLPAEVEKYDNWQRRKLSMRPGITCLWQISGRNEIADFNEWMKLDLEYIDNWSLGIDLKILLKTIPVVLMGKGAK
ncbi:MAG: sugar transferase [Nitrospiraceae bacterium]|nr:MAG: sugar transferase [Nitrospiraceae bacterium]